MNEEKLTRGGLNDIAPNNSDRAARGRIIEPNKTAPEAKPAEKRKLTPVVKGPVTRLKPTFWDKVKTTFLGEGVNARDFVMYDILVPAFRNTMSDMGIGLVEMLFGGGRTRGRDYDSRIIRDRGRSYIDTRVDYRSASERDRRGRLDDRRELDRNDRARHEFGNILYTSRGEAEDVLAHLYDLTNEYGEATVAAFYELSRIEATPSDNNYGWTNLRDAYTDQVRNGYIIRLPQPRLL